MATADEIAKALLGAEKAADEEHAAKVLDQHKATAEAAGVEPHAEDAAIVAHSATIHPPEQEFLPNGAPLTRAKR